MDYIVEYTPEALANLEALTSSVQEKYTISLFGTFCDRTSGDRGIQFEPILQVEPAK